MEIVFTATFYSTRSTPSMTPLVTRVDPPLSSGSDRYLQGWARRAEASGVKILKQMAKTLAAHRSGLLAYYDVMITSGPMEGTNNKISVIQS